MEVDQLLEKLKNREVLEGILTFATITGVKLKPSQSNAIVNFVLHSIALYEAFDLDESEQSH